MRHRAVWRLLVVTLAVGFFGGSAFAQRRGGFETRADFVASNPKPELVPVEAFTFAPESSGLKIDVWATSPQVFCPITMDVDAQGRMWVVEGVDYGQGVSLRDGTSIVVLTDSDADGRADESHVFVAEKDVRRAPLGIAVFDNVVVLSATPDIIVYTDVNRNAVFDEGDTREVLLTGFQGGGHDHTLHAVVGSPSGQWLFSYGNMGANVRTKDDRHFISACYYGNARDIGKKSSDGHLYVGGLAMAVNPDGTGLDVVGQNLRNTHDMVVSSFGDVFHNDNDDPAHCRATWLMEHGNLGYADLRDGSKSWEEVAKPWEEDRADLGGSPHGYTGIHRKGVIRISASHWRESYPGTLPPGDVYGPGSPTGVTLIEGDELGEKFRGTYLACDMVHKALLGFRPTLHDAQIEMRGRHYFLALKEEQRGQFFLPTDVTVGTDGAIYVADMYNSTSRRVMQKSGTIYRISRADGKPMKRPNVDYDTLPGLVAALANPSPSVRWVAVDKLRKRDDAANAPLRKFYDDHADNPYIQVRAVWLLAQLGGEGRAFVETLLKDGGEPQRIVAYRALRHAAPGYLLRYAKQAAGDGSASVRREVAVSLRDVPVDKCRDIWAKVIDGYDGVNRWYVEAIGVGAAGQERQLYDAIVRPRVEGVPHAKWDARAKNLAWRLHTPESCEDLDKVIRAQEPDIGEFRHLIMAYTMYGDEADRARREQIVRDFAKLPAFAGEDYQLTINEVYLRDIKVMPVTHLTQDYNIPPAFGAETEVSSPDVIAKLSGDAKRGEQRAAICLTCHRIGGNGVAFGPNLTAWGQQRATEEVVREIVDPAGKLAHGYEKPVRITGRGKVAEGILTNYSYHAGTLKLKVFGGQYLKLPFRRDGLKVEHLENHSWMPPASKMGLTNQDVRDIAAYLQTLAAEPSSPGGSAPTKITPGFSRGEGPGWVELTGGDFVNVNCWSDTWRWEGSHAWCTGQPTGVIRYREPLKNFELSLEWMHKQKGGNSGVFVWGTPESVLRLANGKGRLPHGIEVQVLDLGYRELYEKQYKKPGDWFTSHGDVFPVGPVKMKPFPPVAPNGKRSFPSQETTLGINQWNHYYVRAVDGEVRLWVNGVEVSGGDGIEPDWGFLCLESEGAPIEFRNIRLRKLGNAPALPEGMSIPAPVIPNPRDAPGLTLEGHRILGTWSYLGSYTREFTADGKCVLRNGDEVIWTKKVVARTPTSVTLEGGYGHVLDGEALRIEGRYTANRKE